MKPTWFVCENCLWWEDTERCHNSSFRPSLDGRGYQDYTVGGAWFCENWTCARCWEGWDEIERKYGEKCEMETWVKNHDKCKEVLFED